MAKNVKKSSKKLQIPTFGQFNKNSAQVDPSCPSLANQFEIRCTSPENNRFYPGFSH